MTERFFQALGTASRFTKFVLGQMRLQIAVTSALKRDALFWCPGGLWGSIFGVRGPQEAFPEGGFEADAIADAWLWPTWGNFRPTWCQLGANLGPPGSNLGQLGDNLAPTLAQLVANIDQLGTKLDQLGPS